MNTSSKSYWTDDPELVEQYVLGRIPEEERRRMDEEIADCEPCKEKIRREIAIAAGIKRYGRDTLRKNLRRRIKSDEGRQLHRYGYVGLAAAVVIIAVGIGVYKFWFNDLTAPNHFGKKQIVIHQAEKQNDTSAVQSQSVEENNMGPHGDQISESTSGVGESSVEDMNVRKEKSPGAAAAQKKRPLSAMKSAQTMKEEKESHADRLEKKQVKPFSQEVWLIGTVEMIPGPKTASPSAGKSPATSKGKVTAQTALRGDRPARVFTFQKDGRSQQIVIQKRALYELPPSRRTAFAVSKHIETLVEHNEKGLNLILFNDNISEEDLTHASIALTPSDSLIVTMQDQTVVYRLPQSWNFHEQTLIR